MKENVKCGCMVLVEQGAHTCAEIPVYHFGNHICECGFQWINE